MSSSEGDNLRNPAKVEQGYFNNDMADRMHRGFIDFKIIHQTPNRREDIIVPVIIRRTITSPNKRGMYGEGTGEINRQNEILTKEKKKEPDIRRR
jgi:hypothetical protein